MDLTTNQEKNYSKEFNIVEYSLNGVKDRHHFNNINEEVKPQQEKELYRSHFIFNSSITDYYENHINEKGNHTTSGFKDNIWADFVVIDIDNENNLAEALESTRKLLNVLQYNYNVELSHININFSGSKGFHIRIPSELFGGFIPSIDLNEYIKNIVIKLIDRIIVIDETIYNTTSLVRVVNTINCKSGLYAIPLTYTELLNKNIEEIKHLAVSPRQITSIDREELEALEELVELKNKCLPDNSNIEGGSQDSTHNTEETKDKNYWEPQNEGNRHGAMIRLIGHLASHGLSDKEIEKAIVFWNEQNKPPKDKEKLLTELKYALSKFGNNKGSFWNIRRSASNGKINVGVSMSGYIEFLEKAGYAKKKLSKSYALVKINENKLREIELFEIKDNVIDFIKSYKDLNDKHKKLLLDQMIGFHGLYFSCGKIEFIRSINSSVRKDTKSEAYLYFKNGYVTISKEDGISFNNYNEMEGLIWESMVIPHEIYIDSVDNEKSVFEKFLMNVCRQSDERMKTMKSAIGYLLHEYKDSSNAKAIVLVDEKIPSSGEPNGRTGKSILGKAVSLIRKSSRIDAKNFEFDSKFTFQEVYLDTKIVEFNDVKKNFSFENLFSVITDNMTVEYKGVPKYTIPFSESPKFLISTNYTIKGRGSSYTDRLFEIEFSDYYNEHHKPIDDFGHVFFGDDWDQDEWNRFYNFMMGCIKVYLEEGLVGYSKINLELRKLIDNTSKEFVEFAEEEIIPEVEHNKRKLFNDFQEKYNDFSSMRQRTFTGWVEEYSRYKGYIFFERKSNGADFCKLRSSQVNNNCEMSLFN